MKILILPDQIQASDRTAQMIVTQLRCKPASVLGFATGGTMEPVYAALIRELREGGCATDRMVSFNLDEYVGLRGDHPQSYRYFMAEHLFTPLGITSEQTHLPDGAAPDPDAEALRYDAAIAQAGGIDLQLLGLGPNGHIGFNEPSSSLGSRTRVKTLTRRTRTDNARFFGPGEEVPSYAITMGIATIMEARAVVLLATGAAKAQVLAAMAEGPVSARCPASALQYHPRVTVICDEAAASDLQLRDYYETVHPGGAETLLNRKGE